MKVTRKPAVDIRKMYKSLGSAVKTKRERNGLTQRQVGELINLSRGSAGLIEQGKQRVLFHDAIILSKILGFSLDDIVGQVPIDDVRFWVAKRLRERRHHGSQKEGR